MNEDTTDTNFDYYKCREKFMEKRSPKTFYQQKRMARVLSPDQCIVVNQKSDVPRIDQIRRQITEFTRN